MAEAAFAAQYAAAYPSGMLGTADPLLHSSGQSSSEMDMPDRENPKTSPTGNTEKDPEDWVSGDESMTGAQTSYLKTLSEQAHDPDAFSEDLTKAEASERIDALKSKLGL